jgi:hypothetical protein
MRIERIVYSPDEELTTREAAAYLSGPVGLTITTKDLYSLRGIGREPLVEKRNGRLFYRCSALDAFLREHGTDIRAWSAGWSRGRAGHRGQNGVVEVPNAPCSGFRLTCGHTRGPCGDPRAGPRTRPRTPCRGTRSPR